MPRKFTLPRNSADGSGLKQVEFFEPGQQLVELFVILDGSLELIDTSGDQERILAVHGTRGFVGEISLLTGRRATSLCRVKSVAEVIRIPVDAVRRLLVSSASFAEKWMTSLLRRRELILARGVDGLHVFGDRADAATLRLREFMHRNGVPHRWVDTDDQDGVPVLQRSARDRLSFRLSLGRARCLCKTRVCRFRGLSRRPSIDPKGSVRHGHHWRRPCWPGGGCLRGLRRATHAGARPVGTRRTGGIELAY